MKHRKAMILLLIISISTQALGIISNGIVMLLNGGMPSIAYTGAPSKWVPITQHTRLAFLSDIIPVGNYVGSVGDIFLVTGMVTIIAAVIIALPQGRKLSPLLVASAFGIILSRAEGIYVATLLFLMAALATVLAMYGKYRSGLKGAAVK